MSEELIHSDLGASSTERWFNCPGSVQLCEPIPEPKSSTFADEGSCAHEVVAEALKANQQAWFFVGDTHFDHKVTDEMSEFCQIYLTYVEETVQGRDIEMHVERQLRIKDTHNELWGTSDCTLCEAFGVLEVIDFKYGKWNVVEVKDNTQLLYYALGAYEEFNAAYEFSSIKLTVVQPRAFHHDGPIRSWTIPVEEIVAFRQTLLKHVAETKKPKALLQKGDWCKWCRAAPICPERNNEIKEVMQVEFQDLDKPATIPFNPEDISKALLAIPRIRSWINAVNAASLHLAGQGVPIPGFKVVRSRKNRAFIDKEKVELYLAKSKVIRSEVYKETLKTPKQVLAALPAEVAEAVELMIHTPPGILTLAPDCDIRPELFVSQTIDVEFQDLGGCAESDKVFAREAILEGPSTAPNFEEDEFEKEFGSITDKPEPSKTLVIGESQGAATKKGDPEASDHQLANPVAKKKMVMNLKSISKKDKLKKSLRRK